MLSLENPPRVLEASESDPIRACWIALGTNDAAEIRKGNQPWAGWDPQDKPLRPVLEAVGENVSIYLGLFLGLNFPSMPFSKLWLSPTPRAS